MLPDGYMGLSSSNKRGCFDPLLIPTWIQVAMYSVLPCTNRNQTPCCCAMSQYAPTRIQAQHLHLMWVCLHYMPYLNAYRGQNRQVFWTKTWLKHSRSPLRSMLIALHIISESTHSYNPSSRHSSQFSSEWIGLGGLVIQLIITFLDQLLDAFFDSVALVM